MPNKAELTEDYYARADNTEPDAVSGQDLPFTPDNKMTLTGRYSFDLGSLPSSVQLNWTYTDSMYNDIFLSNREEMDAYETAYNFRFEDPNAATITSHARNALA